MPPPRSAPQIGAMQSILLQSSTRQARLAASTASLGALTCFGPLEGFERKQRHLFYISQAEIACVVPHGRSDLPLRGLCWPHGLCCFSSSTETPARRLPFLPSWSNECWVEKLECLCSGIGMFEAMRLSTHVLSSPCTIVRTEVGRCD